MVGDRPTPLHGDVHVHVPVPVRVSYPVLSCPAGHIAAAAAAARGTDLYLGSECLAYTVCSSSTLRLSAPGRQGAGRELLQQDCAPETASVIAVMYVDLLCVVHTHAEEPGLRA